MLSVNVQQQRHLLWQTSFKGQFQFLYLCNGLNWDKSCCLAFCMVAQRLIYLLWQVHVTWQVQSSPVHCLYVSNALQTKYVLPRFESIRHNISPSCEKSFLCDRSNSGAGSSLNRASMVITLKIVDRIVTCFVEQRHHVEQGEQSAHTVEALSKKQSRRTESIIIWINVNRVEIYLNINVKSYNESDEERRHAELHHPVQ